MYISPSNIIETGYTNGTQFVIESNQTIYSGYYHKDKFGNYWTGETHTEDSEQLSNLLPESPIPANKPISFYNTLNTLELPSTNINSDVIIPSDDDYNKGFFSRYIIRYNNSVDYKFIEVNKDNFKKIIQLPNISILYNATSVIWKLTGPLNDVYNGNIRVESGIKDTNLRSIQESEKTFSGLSLYLTDPLQFYKRAEASNLYTSGGEFKTANGQNYIGDYHIHNSKGPMVGKTHTKKFHENLFPINETISIQANNQQNKKQQPTSSYNPSPMNMGSGFSGGGGY